jgi:hypothetical protein
MSGSRLPEDDYGFLPRKVADMLQSDPRVHAAFTRLSTLVRTTGLSPRVIDRVMAPGNDVSADVLALVSRGLCDDAPANFKSLLEALNSDRHKVVCRACLMAAWMDFVVQSTGKSGVSSSKIVATSLATAETAHWLAGRHVIEPEEAFRAAVLVDAGLVAMVYVLPEVYSSLAASKLALPLQEFEMASFGFDHQAVGEAALRLYKFPDEVADFAHNHHAPSIEQDLAGKVLKAATVAVGAVGGDFGFSGPPIELDRQTLEGALIKPADGQGVLDYASSRLSAALEFTQRRRPNAA